MDLYTLFRDCSAVERRYWEYCKFVKQNPVRHKRFGEMFLKECFNLFNPHLDIPKESKKEAPQDSIWYTQTDHTLLLFFLGTYLYKAQGRKIPICSISGKEIPFPYVWYILCLYHDWGQKFEERGVPNNLLEEWEVEKKKGRNIFEDRKLLYQMFPEIRMSAPAFPLPRHMCCAQPDGMGTRPEGDDGWWEQNCTKGCRGEVLFAKGDIVLEGYESPESKAMFFYEKLIQERRIDHGVAGADYMFGELTTAYKMFRDRVQPYITEDQKLSCEPYKIFACMAESLACHTLYEEGNADYPPISIDRNPLLYLLVVAGKLNPIGKFSILNTQRLMGSFDMEYLPEENGMVWGISRALAETEEGEKYIKELRKLRKQTGLRMDIQVRDRW